MKIARLVKIAPTLLLVAFLAYAAYSIQVSLSNPAATRSGQANEGDAMGTKALASDEVGAASTGDQVRDPFQGGSRPVAPAIVAPEPEQAAPITLQSDPIAVLVQEMSLEATFIQGRDQIVIIDGRMYSKGQQLLLDVEDDSGKSSSTSLLVARVMPTKVILQAGNTQYELGYPNQLGRRPDDGPRTGSEPPRVPDLTALGPTNQLGMIQTLLNLMSGKGNNPIDTGKQSARPRGASRPPRSRGRRPATASARLDNP